MTTRYNLIINSHWIVADNNRLSFWYAVINADCHLLKTIYRQRGYKSLLVQTARWVFVAQTQSCTPAADGAAYCWILFHVICEISNSVLFKTIVESVRSTMR